MPVDLGRDATTAKAPSIMKFESPSIYVFSREEIVIMIQTADAFANNNHDCTAFHENALYRYAVIVLD